VQADLLVIERADRTKANGDPFVTFTLSNASGTLETAPLWTERLDWSAGVARGSIVQVIGDISLYARNGSHKRQLTLTAPLRILPVDGVDVAAFLPSVGDCTRLWDWIDKQRAEMKSVALQRVVDLFFADDTFRLRFERTPGSPSGHHAKVGGLLQHVYEVVAIAKTTARTMRANLDLVVAGALLHDIGKVDAYDVSPTGFTVTPTGHLLGHVVLGALMLDRASGRLPEPLSDGHRTELLHMILSHHGALEFGSPVRPMTTEAEIVHWADEASAKANDMAESLEDPDAFASNGEISDNKPWRVGRKIWRRPHEWE